MTAETLHDAITLLPSDLIAQADKKRNAGPKIIPWRRYAAMAACFAVVLGCSLFALQLFRPKGTAESMMAADFAAPQMQSITADAPAAEAAPMEEIAPEAPAAGTASLEEVPASDNAAASADHRHSAAAQPQTAEEPVEDWCGNTVARIYADGKEYSFSGSNAVLLSNILVNLDYDPEKLCRCMVEFTADTELMTGFGISLSEHFVRYGNAQADLTQEQTDTLQSVLDAVIG